MVADENDLAEDLEILMARLRRERKRLGLTQQAVAQRMNVSQSRVSAIETGAVEATEVGTLARYVNALGVRLRLSAEFSK
jgi:transcriptional regulator with XRE-family HTH domain